MSGCKSGELTFLKSEAFRGPPAFSIYQPRRRILSDGSRFARIATMTVPRLVLIAFACLVFIDLKFGGGRALDALWDQAKSLGYWLNNEFQGITYRIARG
jgi:hypothetical protein